MSYVAKSSTIVMSGAEVIFRRKIYRTRWLANWKRNKDMTSNCRKQRQKSPIRDPIKRQLQIKYIVIVENVSLHQKQRKEQRTANDNGKCNVNSY